MIIAILFALAKISTGSIAGHVVLGEDEASPLPGVSVCLKGSKICAATDENGYFEIANLPLSGRVILTTELAGGFHKAEHVACVSKGKQAGALLVRTIDSVIDCTASTGHEPIGYGANGTVTDSANRSVQRAIVKIRDHNGKIVWQGRSDRNGRFEASGLLSDAYTLEAGKRQYLQQTVPFSLQYCRPQITLTIPLVGGCS